MDRHADQSDVASATDAAPPPSSVLGRLWAIPVLASFVAGCSGGSTSAVDGTLPPIKPLDPVTTEVDVDVTTTAPGAPVVVDDNRPKSPAMLDLSSVYWGNVCPDLVDPESEGLIADRALRVAVLPLEPRRADPYVQMFAFEAVRAGADLSLSTCSSGPAKGLDVLIIEYPDEPALFANLASETTRDAIGRVFGTEQGNQRLSEIDPDATFVRQIMVPDGLPGDQLPKFRSFSRFSELHDRFRSGELLASETTLQMFDDFVSEANILELKAVQSGSDVSVPEFAVIGVSVVAAPDRSETIVIRNADGSIAPDTTPVQHLVISTAGGLGFGVPIVARDGSYSAWVPETA